MEDELYFVTQEMVSNYIHSRGSLIALFSSFYLFYFFLFFELLKKFGYHLVI